MAPPLAGPFEGHAKRCAREMNAITSFDILYLVRQSALVALFPIVPLVVFSFIGRRRWLWGLCGAASVVSLLLIFGMFLHCNVRIWHDSSIPYEPFRVGPSMYSIVDTLPVLALTLWLPAMLILGGAILVLRLRHRQNSLPLAMLSLIIFFAPLGIFWTWGMFSAIEFSHEDTVWADGFTMSGWRSVTNGMSHADVQMALGPALPNPHNIFSDKPGETAAWWVRNWSAGYFGVVWFQDGVVMKKNFWYMD